MLTGAPNAGKTTLFNALTGANLRTGNYHGVTVGASEKRAKSRVLGTVTDLPGLYALDGRSMEEKCAERYLKSLKKGEALCVLVVDAHYLPRSIRLAASLAERGLSPVFAVTMCKRFRKQGGKIDCRALSKRFGTLFTEVDATNKASVARFQATLEGIVERDSGLRFCVDARIPPAAYRATGEKKSFFDLFFNPVIALPTFFFLVFSVFFLAFGQGMPGELMKSGIEAWFDTCSRRIAAKYPSLLVQKVVCDGVIAGVGGVLAFLPQIAILYAFSDLLEESGFASVLSFATDGLFEKIGLTGRAVFSVLLGYGCTAAAIASTRALESKRMQKKAIACLFFIPCSAKLPVYLTLLASAFARPFLGAVVLYALGTGMGLLASALLSEPKSDYVTEIANIFCPNPILLVKKLLFRLKQFIIKVSTVVLAFTLGVQLLSSFSFSGACTIEESFLGRLCDGWRYAFYPMGIYDWRAVFAAMSGLIAKENIAGLIQALYPEGLFLSPPSAAAYLTFLVLLPPCVSAVSACARELGKKKAVFFAAAQMLFAFLCAYGVYFVMRVLS